VWNHPDADARLKKRILRSLIREIVADVEAQQARSFWSSTGREACTPSYVCRADDVVRIALIRRRRRLGAVRMLARICSDDLIAGALNRNGVLTGRGNRWTRERVTALRSPSRDPLLPRAARHRRMDESHRSVPSCSVSALRRFAWLSNAATSLRCILCPTVPGSSSGKILKRKPHNGSSPVARHGITRPLYLRQNSKLSIYQ